MGRTRQQPRRAATDLGRWRIVADFRSRLTAAVEQFPLAPTWSDPARRLQYDEYFCLFLFGLLNPVVDTMRGLCAASHLQRVQTEVCSRPVSLGSFSEAQHALDPALLGAVFAELYRQAPAAVTGPAGRRWLIQDSSLFDALPRMHWALWRRQPTAQAQVRLHLGLELGPARPARVQVTGPKTCEREAWRRQLQRGDAYVGDRNYGQDYKLFGKLTTAGVVFVVRLRDEAVFEVLEELPLTPADRAANVLRSAWVRLGCKAAYHSGRVRLVWVQTAKEVLLLLTNLGPDELTAGEVALLYKGRWQIELFFRWVKSILGCRHWLAESPHGAALQLYLALIAALLLQNYAGTAPDQRLMELIRWHLVGMASLAELEAGVAQARTRSARKKS